MNRWGRLIVLLALGAIAIGGCIEGIGQGGETEMAPTVEPTRAPDESRPSPIPLDLIEQPSPSETPPAPTEPARPTATPLAPKEQVMPSPSPTLPRPTPVDTRPVVTRVPERVSPKAAPVIVGEAPTELVQGAIADLAKRLGVPEAEITTLSDAAVIWNDGSMGCPKPGEFYIQVPIAGYQIILTHQGRFYDYHADDSAAFLCENELSTGRSVGNEGVMPLELLTLAMTDLGQRLGVATQEIVPQRLVPQVWSDTSLGCPRPGELYAQVLTEGYIILLRAGDEAYTYHTDGERAVLCEP